MLSAQPMLSQVRGSDSSATSWNSRWVMAGPGGGDDHEAHEERQEAGDVLSQPGARRLAPGGGPVCIQWHLQARCRLYPTAGR